MEQSILKSTKKVLGIASDYTAFDLDILTHINSVFVTLAQLGIGPSGGFSIEDDTATWGQFLGESPLQNSVKSYMHLRVRMLFDPPGTGFHVAAMERQIEQMEWRMNVEREDHAWIDPTPVVIPADPWGEPYIFNGGGV